MPRMLRRAAVLGATAHVASKHGQAKEAAAEQQEAAMAAPPPAAAPAPAAPEAAGGPSPRGGGAAASARPPPCRARGGRSLISRRVRGADAVEGPARRRRADAGRVRRP